METNFKDCRWVQASEETESPLFRLVFEAQKAVDATLTICGLGFFEPYLNGTRIGEEWFVPAWSDYEPRPQMRPTYPTNDTFGHRIYYLTYNVLPYLKEGKNALGVRLGAGWYHQKDRMAEGDLNYGQCKLCFLLEWTDQQGQRHSVSSSDAVVWRPSEILKTNLFYGEVHDYRMQVADFSLPNASPTGWLPAIAAETPKARLMPQNCPADRIVRTIVPALIWEDGCRRIYDCGENITGFPRLRLPAKPGAEVVATHSEVWDPVKNRLDYASTNQGFPDQIQADRYCAGEISVVAHPHFTWHGFRYFEVTGPAEVEDVAVVHCFFPISSTFRCSNEVLNWLYDAYIRTQLGNLHCGVPSDCPHRERLGYTGDGQVTAEAALYTLNCRALYEKWMEDIVDGQDPRSGHVQHTAPFYGGGGGPGGWGGAIFRIPYVFYRYYGDTAFLKRYLPNIYRWLDYMESHSENGLVVREEEGGWCLGDWCTPEPPEIPEPFVNTYYYIKGLQTTLWMAGQLELEPPDDLKGRLQRTMQAMQDAFLDPATDSFCGGVNGADAFAIDIGLGTEKTKAALIERYNTIKRFDTGIFGTDLLIDVLFRIGEAELAFRLLTQESDASFARMMNAGATTLWETWAGDNSHNHPMFGGVTRALFRHVLGIRQPAGSCGFSEVRIEPVDILKLDWAEGSIMTPRGQLWVRVERKNGIKKVRHEWR